jgi:hypothetical protein
MRCAAARRSLRSARGAAHSVDASSKSERGKKPASISLSGGTLNCMRIDPTTSASHARFSEIEVGCWRREMGNTLESRENLRTMEEAGEGGEGPNSSFTEFPKSFELPSGLGSGWRLYSRRCVDYARPEDAEPQKGATMARPLEKLGATGHATRGFLRSRRRSTPLSLKTFKLCCIGLVFVTRKSRITSRRNVSFT